MVGQWRHLLAVALAFLTRVPLRVAYGEGDLRRAAPAFPLVGGVVAAAGVAVYAGTAVWWGSVVATVAAVLAMVAVTGGLHEDGLADTADGLWGGHDPGRRLEIMRDSRVGAYGIVALAGSLGLRVALLAPLGLAGFTRAVLCGAVLGRAAMLVLAAGLPPAAPGRGAAVGRIGAPGAVLATFTVAAALWLAAGWWAGVPLLAGLAGLAIVAVLARRRLGGVTGDVLGAGAQVVEIAVIAAVAALVRAGHL